MSGTVTCDKCNSVFAPEVNDVSRRSGGIERFFRCPICKRKYPVANITPLGAQLMGDIKRTREELQKFPDSERLKEELQGLIVRLGPEVTKP
jgi:transposase-like protein